MTLEKTPSESKTEISRIVRPMDANTTGSGYGGSILDWMDMAASICARRYSHCRVNTLSVDGLQFLQPLQIGHVAKIEAMVTRTFFTSMEGLVNTYDEDTIADTLTLATTGFFILVGLDEKNSPTKIPQFIPQTDEEKELWEAAGTRRENRKKMKRNG